jgi:predicted  nucleic acid-binding Zn-ribbon protein
MLHTVFWKIEIVDKMCCFSLPLILSKCRVSCETANRGAHRRTVLITPSIKRKVLQMSETPFQTFIDLISFDQKMLANEKAIAVLKKEIVDLHYKEKQVASGLEHAKSNTINARKAVDKLELEMKTLDAHEREKKQRLENSTDYKQYQSLKSEIDQLKRKQTENEEILIGAWNQLEATQRELESIKQIHAQSTQELEQLLHKKEQEIKDIEQDLVIKKAERVEKEKLVPAEWIEKYVMMRARVSDPVVPVINGNCSACVYGVTEEDLISLRRKKLLQCKGCFRLLYAQEFEKEIAK